MAAVVTKYKKIELPDGIKIKLDGETHDFSSVLDNVNVHYYLDFNSTEMTFDYVGSTNDFYNIFFPILEGKAGKKIEILLAVGDVPMILADTFCLVSMSPYSSIGLQQKKVKILITNPYYVAFEKEKTAGIDILDSTRLSYETSNSFSGDYAITAIKLNEETFTSGIVGNAVLTTNFKYGNVYEPEGLPAYHTVDLPFLPKLTIKMAFDKTDVKVPKFKQVINDFQLRCKMPDILTVNQTNNHLAFGSFNPMFELTDLGVTITLEDYYKFYINLN